MSQPPYPPQGGSEPGGGRPDDPGWTADGGADDPTRRLDAPDTGGQREQTRQFPYGPPAYGEPGQYGPPAYGQPPYGPPPSGQPGKAPYGPPGQAP